MEHCGTKRRRLRGPDISWGNYITESVRQGSANEIVCQCPRSVRSKKAGHKIAGKIAAQTLVKMRASAFRPASASPTG